MNFAFILQQRDQRSETFCRIITDPRPKEFEGLIIIKLLLIVVAVATVFCLLSAIASLIAASREMELPDIEDIEIVE